MARAKLDDAVIFEIKSYRSQKVQRGDRWIRMPLDEIEEKMQEARYSGLVKSDMPGRGSIQKYAREYDDIPDETKFLDESFEWHRMHKMGIPWDAGGFVLKMWRWRIERLEQTTPPSFREVIWWWRVHLTDIDDLMSELKVWEIASFIALQEARRDLLDSPIDMRGIEAILAYQPWRDANKSEYESAVAEGRISSIVSIDDKSESPEIWETAERRLVSNVLSPDWGRLMGLNLNTARLIEED